MDTDEDMAADPPLSREQLALVATLSPEQVRAIEGALLKNSGSTWRKVAYVVGLAMLELPTQLPHAPDLYFAQCVKELVARGKLESRGDLSRMHYSEVRVPMAARSNAS